MDSERKATLENESQTIRADLKVWEHQWSRDHNGSKPSRQDIKDCPEIARKYKQYNKLRDILSGKLSDETRSVPKRKTQDSNVHTPKKKSKCSHSSSETKTSVQLPDQTPVHDRTAPSPEVPTSIGPTPHRDGKVLGLFAFLDDKLGATPCKPKDCSPLGVPAAAAPADGLLATPRKGASDGVEDFKLARTPMSVGRKRLFRSMVPVTTPLKETDGNAIGGPGQGIDRSRAAMTTPKSVSKLHFGTPAFLRRRALPALDEAGEYTSPPKMRPTKKRMPFARGLSDLVANLRKVEEHVFDEEEEALREMEEAEMAMAMGGDGGSNDGNGPTTAPARPDQTQPRPATSGPGDDGTVDDTSQPQVLVPDSQKPALLGGFDDEADYDSEPEVQLNRGQPMREYKKKAPKRTTRKVNMRPTFIRRPVEDAAGPAPSDGEEDVIPETQIDPLKAADNKALGADTATAEDGYCDDNDDDDDNDDAYDDMPESGKKRKRNATNKADSSATKKKKDKGKKDKKNKTKVQEKDGSKVKKAARKVNELAHANFKRLKLRNRGAKGGPGHNSRFRRRR